MMGLAAFARPARLVLTALTAILGSLAACLPRGHVELPAQPRASGDSVWNLAQPARYRGDGNRLGDTPEPANGRSRTPAQMASAAIPGMPHINDVARRILYNGVYFEIHVEVNGERGIERGIVPVVWDMLRARTPLSDDAYYARVYTSRGWDAGYQVPHSGPAVILPEAFTPELTPVILDHFEPAFVLWNRNFNGWTQAMASAWMKAAVITVARAWTPELVGGVAVTAARARITGQAALGAAAVPGAAAAARACSGGRCPPGAARVGAQAAAKGPPQFARGGWVLPEGGGGARVGGDGLQSTLGADGSPDSRGHGFA